MIHDKDEMFPPDRTTPYDTLLDLVRFAEGADAHLKNMARNQQMMAKQIVDLQDQITNLTNSLISVTALMGINLDAKNSDTRKRRE